MGTKAARRERTLAWVKDPIFLTEMVESLAAGGTLASFVRERDLKYMMVKDWIENTPSVKEAYEKALAARDEVHRDIVTGGLVAGATTDVLDLFEEDGTPKRLGDIPLQARDSIQGIEVTTNEDGDVTTKIRLVDKTKNRELLGRRHGMFVDKVEHGGTLTMEMLVNASMAAPKAVGG